LPAPPSADLSSLKDGFAYRAWITSPKSGYLQDLDHQGLIEAAAKKKLLILLNNRPGDYLVEDLEIGQVYGKEVIDKDQTDAIRHALITLVKSGHHKKMLSFPFIKLESGRYRRE
jgi:uncharacterized membrane protein